MANGDRVKELLEGEKAGTLQPHEKNAIDVLRGRGEFPPALAGATQVPTEKPELSWGRYLGEEAAPAIGGVLGGLGGALTSPITGPVGPIVGAGAGTAAGRAANPYIFGMMGLEPPKPYTLGELATEAGFGMAGEGAGRAAFKLGRGAVRSIFPSAPSPSTAGTLREAFEATGVTPKVTDISPSRGPAMIEKGLLQSPGQGPITSRVTKQAEQLTTAAEDYLNKVGPNIERAPGGQRISDAIESNVDRWRKTEDQLWSQGIEPRARGLRINIRDYKRAAQELLDKEELKASGQRNEAMIQTLKEIAGSEGAVPYEKLRAWQQGFGRQLEGRSGLVANMPQAESKYMWDKALESIEAGLSHDPQAAAMFGRAREVSRQGNELFRSKNLAKITEVDPEKVVQTLKGAGGPSAVARARQAILGDPALGGQPDQEAWNIARRHILEGIFSTKEVAGQPGKILSGRDMETAVNKIGRDTLKELLSPDELKSLDQIMTVAKAIRAGERVGAQGFTSSTAASLGIQMLTGGAGFVGGGVPGALLTNILAPQGLARILVSPSAAKMFLSPRWGTVSKALQTGGKVTGEGAKLLGRLGGVAAGREYVEEERDR
jgi:hypothetical protein